MGRNSCSARRETNWQQQIAGIPLKKADSQLATGSGDGVEQCPVGYFLGRRNQVPHQQVRILPLIFFSIAFVRGALAF